MPNDLGGAGGGGGRPPTGSNPWQQLLRVLQPIVRVIQPVIRVIRQAVQQFVQTRVGQTGGSSQGGGQSQSGSSSSGSRGGQGARNTTQTTQPQQPAPPEFEGDTPEIPRSRQRNTPDTTFNAREFFGDDFDLAVLGDGIAAGFVTFLDFVIPGNWDREQQATAYQQVRTLFNLATGVLTPQQPNEQGTAPQPPMSTAVIPWAREYMNLNTSDVREIESAVRDDLLNRIEQFDLNRENVDLSVLSTEELVQWYSQRLRRPYGNLPAGAARLIEAEHPLDRDYVERELNRLNSLLDAMNSVLPHQSVDAFMSAYERSSEADARSFLIRNLGQLNDYNLDPDWYEMDTLELVRLWRHELDEFVPGDPNVVGDYNFGAFWSGEGQAIDYLAQYQNLQILENTYVPPPPPDLNLLAIVASIFLEPVDWVMTGIEVIQDLQQGDYGGAAVNVTLALLPFAGGWMDDAPFIFRAADEGGGGGGRLVPNDLPSSGVPDLSELRTELSTILEYTEFQPGRGSGYCEVCADLTSELLRHSGYDVDIVELGYMLPPGYPRDRVIIRGQVGQEARAYIGTSGYHEAVRIRAENGEVYFLDVVTYQNHGLQPLSWDEYRRQFEYPEDLIITNVRNPGDPYPEWRTSK